MLDLDLQRQLRALMPGAKRMNSTSWMTLTAASAISVALTFLFVLYIGEIHKIPLNTARTQLEHMLARCAGAPILHIRKRASARPGRRFPAFSMAEQIEVIQYSLDMLEAGNCVRNTRGPQVRLKIATPQN